MFPRTVILSHPEIYIAAQVGIMRNVASCQRDLPPVGRSAEAHNDAQWSMDINGAHAELAVAKAYNVYWNPSVRIGKATDVGRVQVRSTSRANGRLIKRPNDSDDDIFLLVHCKRPKFQLIGWLYGREAKVERFYKPADQSGGEAWWVDADSLHKGPLPEGAIK